MCKRLVGQAVSYREKLGAQMVLEAIKKVISCHKLGSCTLREDRLFDILVQMSLNIEIWKPVSTRGPAMHPGSEKLHRLNALSADCQATRAPGSATFLNTLETSIWLCMQ